MFNIPFLANKSGEGKSRIYVDGKSIRLIVGLGNPGDKYTNTYHNAGFLFADSLVKQALGSENSKSLVWKNVQSFRYVNLRPPVLMKPTTFMNESGKAVKDALHYFRVEPAEMLVVHDDSDIALGEYKLSSDRGSAGHKGIESIISSLGTKDFYRMRIGIRTRGGKAEDFVLRKVTPEDHPVLHETVEKAARLINSREI